VVSLCHGGSGSEITTLEEVVLVDRWSTGESIGAKYQIDGL